MNLHILAAFNTNSRRLIRIWRSWGLVGSKKRKQGAERVVAEKYENRQELENGLGEVGGAPDWCKMISAIVGTFSNGPAIH